ncbi:MAG: outer membrane lipoprotein-sorting protein [candidate division KSB1 bacterium]|nr:outer membrane lipoprotein-sorting protein [candidate division KSB1 bacterium]MDZ7274257.1 outer membrane lipoprotein-sorting protein [candidate division KSB1 bacterium]MDZ7287221.1 outer membrane lipoprotein-sorting protein [candidate division KSB1 bacterium]MDZ7296855.1 outer membrane lipoprotein-sorting protein [candidate division KSB1 bacterium]MDZ7306041.1 outer membrane lipoprotein-sorting protein [candidate division KSB1 bacterium]
MINMLLKCVTALLLWPGGLLAQQRDEAVAIVRKMDALYRSTSSTGEMEMEIVTPHWQRTLRLQIWTEGMDKTFIRILAPAREKGVATLRRGSEMWNYLPNTNKVIKIPPSMMMSSWMGSDFTNDDLVSEFTLLKDFHFRLITPDTAQPGLLYLEAIPREGLPIVWGKIVTAVQKQDYLPVWEAYFDEKGRLMRVIHFKDVKLVGGRRLPTTLELIPQNKPGHKTVIRYRAIAFDVALDPGIFSLRHLQSR